MAMVFQKMRSLLLFLTILFALRFDTGVTITIIPPKITVEIINDLAQPPTNMPLTFHCKSKDDDFGTLTIPAGGKFTFHFRRMGTFPIPFGSTLFFCTFTWSGLYPTLHYFDIYDQQRDDCKLCSWKISKNGGCMYKQETGRYDICLPWNK